jgi:hypothetical protein
MRFESLPLLEFLMATLQSLWLDQIPLINAKSVQKDATQGEEKSCPENPRRYRERGETRVGLWEEKLHVPVKRFSTYRKKSSHCLEATAK